ncbi:hypothetical protein JG687_00002717, partial [Phytophthora cactorum]
ACEVAGYNRRSTRVHSRNRPKLLSDTRQTCLHQRVIESNCWPSGSDGTEVHDVMLRGNWQDVVGIVFRHAATVYRKLRKWWRNDINGHARRL